MKSLLVAIGLTIGLPCASASASTAERQVTIHSDVGAPIGDCDLGATLLLPDQARALVVFAHGSGPQNRDEGEANGSAPFRDIAEALARQGVASLRFDKRSAIPACLPGVTDPSNPARANPGLRPEHFLRDIEAVYHRAEAEAPGLPIFLLGHSEGVNFVLELVAQGRLNPRGLILLAGLGKYPIDVTFMRQLREDLPQIETALRDPGLKPDERQRLEKGLDQTRDWLRDGDVFFQKIRTGQDRPNDYYVGAYSLYWKEWIAIIDRAAATAARVAKPSILIQGSADTNVTKDDFDALSQALKLSGGTSVYLSGLDHLFAKPGSIQVDPSVPDAIAMWINRQVNGSATAIPAVNPPVNLMSRALPSKALGALKLLGTSPTPKGL